MAKPPPENPPIPFRQKLEFVQWSMRFPALSVMVFLRPDIGYRMLNPLTLIAIFLVMLVFSALFKPPSRPEDLLIFAAVMLALGFGQRVARWRQMRRGVKQHSYYTGTSCFESVLPAFFRREGRANCFIDPVVCAIAGLALLHYSRALAAWLIVAGLCLRLYEYGIIRRELHQALDIADGLVTSGYQSQIVEHFEKPASVHPAHPSAGVPTGLGGDIREQIEARKRSP